MSGLQKFLLDNNLTNYDDIKKCLTSAPYKLKVKEYDGRFLVTYNMMDVNWRLAPWIKECRGVIFDKLKIEPVCWSFNKFFNHGEQEDNELIAKLDVESTRYVEKLDGSLIKLYYYNAEWVFTTNNTIVATLATIHHSVSSGGLEVSFLDYIKQVVEFHTGSTEFDTSCLDKNLCYHFELIHPNNTIVVHHATKELFFLGARDLQTGQEIDEREKESLHIPAWVKLPADETARFSSLDECVQAAKDQSTLDKEGWIAVDKNFTRVKIKTELYVKAHHRVRMPRAVVMPSRERPDRSIGVGLLFCYCCP